MPTNNNRYRPTAWYWLADDGRIFSAPAQAIVPDTDQGYVDFCQTAQPTPWPRDDAGAQTDASLQAVLDPHGVFVNNMYYAANQRWLTESGGLTITGIASAPAGMPILTDDRSRALINRAVSQAEADATFTTTWAAADWQTYPLTNAEIIAMGQQLATHTHDAFITYATAVGRMARGEIASRSQIDEMFSHLRRR